MKKLLINNLGLKLLSIVTAFMLWLIVLDQVDPVTYETYSPIQVVMLNENVVTDQGLVYQVQDNSDVISVRVRAKTSILRELSPSDFTATADMEKNMKYGNLVGIEVTCRNRDVRAEDMTLSRENVVLGIEDASTEQFNVVVDQEGSPPDGYMVGTAVPEQSLIQISGPASVVSKIRRVEAVLPVSTLTSDRTIHCSLRVIDGNDAQLSSAELATLEFIGKEEGMDVKVTMLRTKTVPLRIGYTGIPDSDYSFSSISYKPESVEIAGTSDVITSVTEIVIPDEAVNIDGISENLQTTIEITPYLPDGIRLVDEKEANIAVAVELERKQGRTVDIPVSEIALKNVPRGYEVDFGELENVELTVMGTSAELAELDIGEITATLNLEGYSRKEGEYSETLEVTLPGDAYSLMEEAEVDFELVRATGTSAAGTGTGTGTAPGTGSGTGTVTGNGTGAAGEDVPEESTPGRDDPEEGSQNPSDGEETPDQDNEPAEEAAGETS